MVRGRAVKEEPPRTAIGTLLLDGVPSVGADLVLDMLRLELILLETNASSVGQDATLGGRLSSAPERKRFPAVFSMNNNGPHSPMPLADELPKPRLRGWFHALAAVASVIAVSRMLIQTRDDLPRMLSVLVFGVSMLMLYAGSAVYHLGSWRGRTRSVLRAIDHANIFVLIAGTYTPIYMNVLAGRLRIVLLSLIWVLAIAGVLGTVLTFRLPRGIAVSLYIGMGWLALISLPQLMEQLPWQAIATLVLGGVLYSIGGLVYARRRPNPFPRMFGFHEVFHLLTVAAGAAFLVLIWVWVLPFPRGSS
ncbi:MAG TPA: hemolysin III family protein [Herpetosiphonaceae bacterium]